MRPSDAIAHVRHLAFLGLPSEVVIPRMLEALHALIGSRINGFIWSDARGLPTNIYSPVIYMAAREVMVGGYHLMQRPGELAIEDLINGPRVIDNIAPWRDSGRLERTVLYNEVFVPSEAEQMLDLVLRDRDGPKGIVFLTRGAREKSFGLKDRRILLGLAPAFLRALRVGAPTSADPDADEPAEARFLEDGGSESMIVCDLAGEVLEMSADAHVMLDCANHGLIAPGQASTDLPGLPAAVKRALAAGTLTNTPVTVRSIWGHFRFRAFPTAMASGGGLVVLIRQLETLSLRVIDRLRDTPLSPRQREVALLVATGHGPDAVAARLGVSRSTCRDHLENVHARLGVGSRAELVAALVG
ncbi:helix-turn-helix domain-containing protein [Caulobacter mirabilis]|uniref:HTH luxR-type domain-containing protein n=1 Tax=Caulobacter mirabilis TaxID=69666 RepID=A0A2D2AVS8_9CAUL|nr:helix-turn-helix transcriptional regulator [Caulobacter mirabilis]ATQ42119.1 hypothetical protein CSW64_06670 [Caulobacter mirabilis]